MKRQQLARTEFGATGLEITKVGYGAWAIGGRGWEFGWGPQGDEESLPAIHRGLEHEIDWVDTAATHGPSRPEEVVGRALHGLAPRPFVFTKRSLLEGPGLDLEAIDLYQIHWPHPEPYVDEGFSALTELKAEGPVLQAGVSSLDVDRLPGLEPIAPVQMQAQELSFAADEGIGVIVYTPMGSGLLTGRLASERIEALRRNAWREHRASLRGPQVSEQLATLDALATVATRLGFSPAAVAVAWAFRETAAAGMSAHELGDQLLAGLGGAWFDGGIMLGRGRVAA